jgi:uncharacterized protein
MEISPETKINDLLTAYPFLIDFLAERYPAFSKLKNPLLRKTVGKVATLSKASAMGGVPLNTLLSVVAGEILEQTNDSVTLINKGGKAEQPARPKSRTERQAALKEIIRDLHDGMPVEQAKGRFQELIQDVSATEIADMEQSLIREGMPETEIKRLCDVHVQVFKDSLEKHDAPDVPPGHPVAAYLRENRAAEEILEEVKRCIDEIEKPGDKPSFPPPEKRLPWLLERLGEIHIHYQRKENQLFPFLEEHGITGPSQVMWSGDDDNRALLKKARGLLSEPAPTGSYSETIAVIRELDTALRDMVFKEERVLFPMAIDTLSDEEWAGVAQGSAAIGYAWGAEDGVEVSPEAAPTTGSDAGQATGAAQPAGDAASVSTSGGINLSTGSLTPEEVNLLLTHLPLDLTMVGADDRVKYYSEGPERIFPRSPAIIGREVKNCHPPKSVHMVEEILEAFKSGTRDTADFWISMGGKFIYIRYFAVRDASGAYRGCLEASQEVTAIRALEGERRLLEWE